MTPRGYWKLIRKRLWLILLLMVVAGGGAIYATSQQVPLYRASTTLFINPGKTFHLHTGGSRELLTYGMDQQHEVEVLANTYMELLATRSFARRTANALDTRIPTPHVSAALDSRYLPDTRFLRITATYSDPVVAQDLANTAARVLIAQEQERQQAQREQIAQVLSSEQDKVTTEQALLLDTIVVVDEALVPTTPLPRQTVRWSVLAALAALLIGGAVVLLVEYLDYTIKDPDTLDTVYGVPVLGVFGPIAPDDAPHHNINLVALSDAPSPAAEAFRSLRTGVEVAALNRPINSVLVTSATAGEGTTFVACNLAVSLALNHWRVILVDANLRTPDIHTVFDLPRGPGLTNLIVNPKSGIDSVLQTTSIPNLHIITCGTIPPNPAELLGSAVAACVMSRLHEHADIVIYDAPPVVPVTDAALLAQRTDGVLQVVLAESTRINLVQRCRTILEQVGAHILGPVLNRADLGGSGYSDTYPGYASYQRDSERRRQHLLRHIIVHPRATPAPEMHTSAEPDVRNPGVTATGDC